ncbi:hypothetical protein ANN_23603 [Periplaneta americana]|uniref:Uncharacterized protein n=1 Tax=Periplaneta americana TaxID=6978 RepID=A0ABQ8SNM2_PERAM|nr:hypothetical protein ANN_23603 [Periplaneta americana]
MHVAERGGTCDLVTYLVPSSRGDDRGRGRSPSARQVLRGGEHHPAVVHRASRRHDVISRILVAWRSDAQLRYHERRYQCAVSSTQKFLVQQHITTSKHQANKQLNSKQRQLFLTQPTTSNVRSGV